MTALTEKQIDDRLFAIHEALVEKLEKQPFLEPTLRRAPGEPWRISIYREFIQGGDYLLCTLQAPSIEKVISEAEAFVAKVPALRDMRVQDFQKKLAKVIDEAEALSLPNNVVTPLREGSQALANNLLAAE